MKLSYVPANTKLGRQIAHQNSRELNGLLNQSAEVREWNERVEANKKFKKARALENRRNAK